MRYNFTKGTSYWLAYECRDIGYGVEEDNGDFVFWGLDMGRYVFTPCKFVQKDDVPRITGEPIYLFDDEIVEVETVDDEEAVALLGEEAAAMER